MAGESSFNPDVLLSVGADISQLRQNIELVRRELSAQPVRLNVETNVSTVVDQFGRAAQQAAGSFNDVKRAVGEAGTATSSLRSQQQAYARDVQAHYENAIRLLSVENQAIKENNAADRKRGLEVVEAERLYQEAIRRRGLLQTAAAKEDEDRILRRGRLQVAAAREDEDRIQARGRLQAAAGREDEERIQRRGRLQAAAGREDETRDREQIRRLQQVEGLLTRINLVQIRAGAAVSPQTSQTINQSLAQAQALQATLQAGGNVNQNQILQLTGTVKGLESSLRITGASAAAATGALDRMFGRFGRYIQIATQLTLVYGAMRFAFEAVDQLRETDKTLALIEATAERSANKFELLRASYDLIVQGNQILGKSFEESGKVVFELQKALDGNVEQIKGAYLPALALASTGEGNQTEIVKTLIGTYELFGNSLGDALTPLEKYTKISDSLLSISIATIPSVEDFRTALQTVAPAARASNVSLDATLSLLATLQQGMQGASRAGTGLARIFNDIRENAPRIGKIFDIPIDINKPLDVLKILLDVATKIRAEGPGTIETANKIRQAFGDERAERALLTLVELLPKFRQLMDQAGDSTGKTNELIRILGGTLEAAQGRLKGTIFAEINKILADLQEIQPGKADGVVAFLDRITLSIKETSKELAVFAGLAKFLLDLPGAIKSLDFSKLGENAAKNFSQNATAQDKQRLIESAGRLGITYLPPRSIADEEAPFRNQLYNLPPRFTQFSESQLRQQLNAQAAQIQREAQAAIDRNNPYLSFDVRILNAKAEATRAANEAKDALKDFQNAIFGRGGDRDQAAKQLLAAYEKAGRANLEVIKLQRDEQEAGIRELQQSIQAQERQRTQQQAINEELRTTEKSVAKIRLSNELENAFTDGNMSARAFNETVETLRRSIADGLTPDTDKLYDVLVKAFEQGGITFKEYEAIVDRVNKAIAEKTKATYEQIAGTIRRSLLSDAQRAFADYEREFAKAVAVGLRPEELDKLANKAVGLDQLTDSIRLQTAILGKWGVEAAVATALASKGFASLDEAKAAAFADGNEALLRFIAALEKLRTAYPAKIIADLKGQIDEQTRALKASEDAYGTVGIEAAKYSLALNVLHARYGDLLPDQQELIDQLAVITEKLRNAAAASGLVRLGFNPKDAEAIAQQASDINAIQAQKAAGIEAIRTLADATKVARQQQLEFISESTKATGDFVSYFLNELNKAATAGADFWDGLGRLAQETAQAMSSALSDFFFDTFTGKVTSAKKLWEDFLNSILRSISNFLAQQATKAFLNLLIGTGSGAVGAIGGGGGGGGFGGGGGGGSVTGIAEIGTQVFRSFLGAQGPTATQAGSQFGVQSFAQPVAQQGAAAIGGGPGIYSGIVNAGVNYTLGGVSGVAFGVPTVVTGTGTSAVAIAVPAGTEGYALAELGAIGVDASVGTGTSGLLGAGGSLGGAISSATVVLAALAAAYEVYTGVTGLIENRAGTKGYNAALGGLTGVAAGAIIGTIIYPGVGTILGAALGGAVGGIAGGFFGVDPEETTSYRIRAEQARAFYSANASLTGIGATQSPKAFTDYLIKLQSGYVGGQQGISDNAIAIGFRNLTFTPQQFLDAVTKGLINYQTGINKPTTPEQLTAAVAAGTIQGLRLVNGQIQGTIGIGRPNPYYTTLTGQGFQQFYNETGGVTVASGTGTQPQGELYALLQQGLDRNALDPANNAIIQAIRMKFAALADVNILLNKALNEVLKQTVLPATTQLGDEVIRQAKLFRQTIQGLIVANAIEISSNVSKLQAETDPTKVISYVDTIRQLIEARYNDEIDLVKKFASALDDLASGFKEVSQSIQDQIDALNQSNFGPTNPRDAFLRAQTRFGEARDVFLRDPTPQNAARVQQLAEPLLQAAGNVFTRPSSAYQDIFQNTINTLAEIRDAADRQAADITQALTVALGNVASIDALVEQNTKAMAEDLKLLRQLAERRLIELGFTITNPTLSPEIIAQIQAATAANSSVPVAPVQLAAASTTPTITLTPEQQASLAQQQYYLDPYQFGPNYGMSEGGLVGRRRFGARDPNDTVPAMLAPGEFVVPRDIASQNLDLLQTLVRTGQWEESSSRNASLYLQAGGSSVAATLTISPGAIVINGATDPTATGKAVVEIVETSIRTGRLGRVISERVKRT